MALNDILRSGINNAKKRASNVTSGLESFDVNSINSNLTRGIDQLGGSLGKAGGLIDQAGALSSSATNALSRLGSDSISGLGDISGLGSGFSNLDQVFQGKIESLSRANIISQTNNLTGSLSSMVEGTNITNLFTTDTITQNLNGLKQNISVLPAEAGNLVSSITNQSSATSSFDITNFFRAEKFSAALETELKNFGVPNVAQSNRSGQPSDFEMEPSASDNAPRLKNTLRNYANYTYNLELSVLSPFEINSPEDSYRNGLTNSIVRSGGGNYGNRVKTYAEETYDGDAEYYIDGLETLSLMSPNSRTGITPGSTIRFSVTEPYSMGQFLEALAVGASVAGYGSYIEAPFVLKINFIGMDQDGKIISDLAAPPKFMPIKLTNIEFDVKTEGCVYEVEAIPYNEMALTNQTSIVRTDVSLSGRTVLEALETGNPSNPGAPPLTDILNGRGQSIADAGAYDSPDRYIIMFPTDSQGATRAVTAAREADFGRQQGATNTITETQASQIGAGLLNTIRAQGTEVIPDGAVFDVLQRYARENVNEIGESPIIQDVNQDGDRRFGRHDEVIDVDDARAAATRGASSAQMDETTRNANYTQNTSIISIIEDMVLSSDYGRRISEEQSEEGVRQWFRIETQVFIEENPATQIQRGTPPKIFVYSVVPYFPDESRFQGSSQRSSNTQTLRNLALKEYNYFYTGLNEDVLDFQVQFNTAFFQNVFSDLGQHSAAMRTRESGETVAQNQYDYTEIAPPGIGPVSNGQLSEPNVATEEITRSSDHANGGQRLSASIAAKRSIAQSFQDTLINSDVDLVNAEMEIWGDPYWIPESGMGNYNAAPSGVNPNLTADGTVTGQHSDIFVLVNFRTPFDYDSNTGQMQFSNVVKPFSGIYMVTQIENNFSGGKFTQNIKMLRKRGQNDEGTGNNTDATQLGTGQVISGANAAANGESTGSAQTGQPNNSGVTSVPGGAAGVSPNTPSTGPNGEPIPTTGGGGLSTIRTSKRGIETQIASIIAEDMQGFINELENDYGYEITQFGGYVDRYISGTTKKSWHASGIAIDINWASNPDNRNRRLITDLPTPPNGSEMTALAAKYGLGWGGDWTGNYIDPMHFSAATNERGTLIVQRGVIPANRNTS